MPQILLRVAIVLDQKPKSFNVPQSAECSLADSYSFFCPVITCCPLSPVLQAPQSLFGPLSMPPPSPLSAALAADITSWGIFVFNALPSTHIISHVISAWSVTWSVHVQSGDQCMISPVISAFAVTCLVHGQSRDQCMMSHVFSAW